MALVPEFMGLAGSFIRSNMALLLLGPSSYLGVSCRCACTPVVLAVARGP